MRAHHIERRQKGSRATGCVGISFVTSWNGRTRTAAPRRYFSAHTRRWDGRRWRAVNRKFCLNTLGREEAWRRALKVRAQYETVLLEKSLPQTAAKEEI